MNVVHCLVVSGKMNKGTGGSFWPLTCFGIFHLQSTCWRRE